MTKSEKIFLLTTLALLLVDRVGKWFAVSFWSRSAIEPLPGVRFGFLMNRGFVFSVPSDAPALLVTSGIACVAFVVWFIRSIRKRNMHDAMGIGVILLAAISNGFDRVYYGGVVDFLQIGFPVLFNFADVVIMVGLVRLVFRPHPPTPSPFVPSNGEGKEER